ncbi:MAG: NAD-binding protein, partial [SAR324 cluster bacterium]|nr:NAD-binding protein [SAR324 cluster bacterium]
VLVETPLLVGGLFLVILIGKFSIATVAALCMRFPFRVALLAGAGLAQVGEFSFVLGKAGEAVGLMTAEESRVFLAASVMTMLITPILVRFAPHFAAGMAQLNPLERVFGGHGADEVEPEHPQLRNHVIIAGFGLAGRALAHSLKQVDIPYIVLELNPASVDRYRGEGEPIYYGDITSAEVLHHCNYLEAREVVLVISDPAATRRAVSAVRALAPELLITVRTRYFDEVAELQKLGATDVVVEEFENAVEMMARVLRRAGTPRNVIAARIAEARESKVELMRPLTLPRQRLMHFAEVMEQVKLDSYLMSGEDWAAGRSCHDINLRSVTGASVVALRRGEKIVPNPSPREKLQAGDVVYLLGDQPAVTGAMMFFQSGQAPQAEAQDSADGHDSSEDAPNA